MSKVLSQEEVEALLKSISQQEKENGDANKSYRKYDFKNKKTVNYDFGSLDIFADKFCDDLKSFLSNFFMKNMKVKKTKVTSVTLKEFKERLKFPSGIGIFKLDRKDSLFFVIVIDDTTAYAFIELFFGGPSITEKKFEERPFTIIEQRVIKKIYDEMIRKMNGLINNFFNCDICFYGFEISPKYINFWSDKDRLGLVEMDISMGNFDSSMAFLEDVAGKMYLVLPVQSLILKEELEKVEDDDYLNEKIINIIESIPLNVFVELGKVSLSIQEIINLKKDDVIVLDKHVNQELDIFLEGKLKLKGIHGISKGMHALKITNKI